MRVRLELAIPGDVVIPIADLSPAQPVDSLRFVGVVLLGFVVVSTIQEGIVHHEQLIRYHNSSQSKVGLSVKI